MIARRPFVTALVALLAAAGPLGCIAPPTATDRLTDAAYEMNMATRFGRMDVALSFIGEKVRKQFVASHAGWGRGIRIADLEFAGVEVPEKEAATVLIHVSWQRIDESTLRTTSIVQRWKDHDDHGWLVVEEKRIAGDAGLIDPVDAPLSPSPVGAPIGAPEAPNEAPRRTASDAGRYSTVVIPADEGAMD